MFQRLLMGIQFLLFRFPQYLDNYPTSLDQPAIDAGYKLQTYASFLHVGYSYLIKEKVGTDIGGIERFLLRPWVVDPNNIVEELRRFVEHVRAGRAYNSNAYTLALGSAAARPVKDNAPANTSPEHMALVQATNDRAKQAEEEHNKRVEAETGIPLTSTTTTLAPKNDNPWSGGKKKNLTESTSKDDLDRTSILRGKNINPESGTQNDDVAGPKSVAADNVYNEIQQEHAAHTLPQTTPGGAQALQERSQTFDEQKDGDRTPGQAKKRSFPGGPQNDDPALKTSAQEQVNKDGNIGIGETGDEKRLDLQDQSGGGAGSNKVN